MNFKFTVWPDDHSNYFLWSFCAYFEMQVIVHNLALSFFLFTTVTTRCFKLLNLMLKYVCFTLISTFNLTPSATGMTGRDGRKTLGFYRLVRLVASCPSLLVLKYKEFSHFVFRSVPFGNHYDWLCWS